MSKICAVCKGEAQPGITSYTFERNGHTLVVDQVPADVCVGCGEAYVNDLVAGNLLIMAAECRTSPEPYVLRHYATI